MNASSSPPIPAPGGTFGPLGKRPVAFSQGDDDEEAARNVSSRRSSEGSSTAQPVPEAAQCYVCGRSFGTWKALFGHMRCHPEREWRGVRPLPGGEAAGGRRKWRRVAEEAAAVGTSAGRMGEGEGGYACGECTRVFGTRQALGGHRASHRGVMGCSAKAKDTTGAATAAAVAGGVGGGLGGVERYVCVECDRQFASYHGMRVHQRIHRQPERERGRRRMLDLNLPPPPE